MVFQCENRAQDRSKNPTILTLPVAFSIWPVANSKTIHFSTNKEYGPLQKKKNATKNSSLSRELAHYKVYRVWYPQMNGYHHIVQSASFADPHVVVVPEKSDLTFCAPGSSRGFSKNQNLS